MASTLAHRIAMLAATACMVLLQPAAQAAEPAGMPPIAPVSAAVDWPTAMVRMVVGYPPGGPNDLIARSISQRLTATSKQSVIVDNKGGASGTIGSEIVARAAPDGNTLMLNATTHAAVNALYEKLPFDADKDFTTISLVGLGAAVLVINPELPIHSVAELITYAKANPGKLTYASTGNGSSPHLAAEMFRQAAGLDLIHVAYKGSAPAMTDLIGGQVAMMFEAMPSASPNIKAGRIRALAVTTLQRASAMPDVPTISESGLPGFEVPVWWGIFGPANIDKALADRISNAVNATLASPEVRERFAGLGIEPVGTTPQAFRDYLRRDMKRYGKVIKDGSIHAN